MDLQKDAIMKFEEIEKRIHSLNKKIETTNAVQDSTLTSHTSILGTQATTLGTHSSILETHSFTLQELDNRMNSVENAPSTASIFNVFEKAVSDIPLKSTTTINFGRFFFICDNSCLTKVKVKLRLRFYTSTAYTATLYCYLNSLGGTPLYTQSIPYSNNSSLDIEFEHDFYPTKPENYIYMRITSGIPSSSYASQIEITSASMEVIGKDIIILNRSNDFRVFITKNNYYITKNTPSGGKYLLTPTNNVDLSTFTDIPNLVPTGVSSYAKYFPFDYTYLPNFSYNSTTELFEIDNSKTFFVFSIPYGSLIASSYAEATSTTSSITNWSNKGWSYVVGHPGKKSASSKNIGIINSSSTSKPFATETSIYSLSTNQLSLNSSYLSDLWVSNTPVFYKNWEDNANGPFMYVITNESAENFFMPERAASYTVALGKGTQTSAYLQSDGSITIYMRWKNSVYKKTLIYNNSTSQYELSDTVVEYPNAWEILEGYTTDYFINRKGSWEYVSPEA